MAKPHTKYRKQHRFPAIMLMLFILAFLIVELSPSFTGFVPSEDALPSQTVAPESSAIPVEPIATPEPTSTPVPDVLTFPGGIAIDRDMRRIKLDALDNNTAERAAELIKLMPDLSLVDLAGSDLDSSALLKLCSANESVRFLYSFEFCGNSVDMRTETINLTGISHDDIEQATEYIACLPQLTTIDLGSSESSPEVSWEDIGTLQTAAPWAKVDYNFKLCGRDVSTADGLVNLNHVKMSDGGASVRAIMPYMHAKYLDMDSCNVSNEDMAALRDDFPDTKVVWRVRFGPTGAYTARTDETRILASKPSKAGNLSGSNADSLKYCTDIKYIDIGHNEPLESIEFMRTMPHLQSVILAMANVSDLTPLTSSPHIKYLEIFSMPSVSDISSLSDFTELRHLAIMHNSSLSDISPIMDLELDRLWIGPDYLFPYEQIEEYRSKHPYCQINLTTVGDNMDDWRYTSYDINTGVFAYVDTYRFLRDQMGYSILLYSFPENDPRY